MIHISLLLFSELQPYKYAGYPMLMKTIRMETNDDSLFSKSAPLLSAATELAYHTVSCSALNAEELRRENGIQVRHLTVLFLMLKNYVEKMVFRYITFLFCS